ncbi:MAG: hypothetical protein MI921_17425 [Cytophagales bacterium]|nr:hypothetical protein [Cytophagales bacterium]
MKIKIPKNLPLINLPPKVELALFLIKTELKNVRFTNDLNEKDIDTYNGFLDLSTLISSILGFGNNLPDEFKEWYFDRQTQLVENIDLEDDQELLGQALHSYVDLGVKKQELKTEIGIH